MLDKLPITCATALDPFSQEFDALYFFRGTHCVNLTSAHTHAYMFMYDIISIYLNGNITEISRGILQVLGEKFSSDHSTYNPKLWHKSYIKSVK